TGRLALLSARPAVALRNTAVSAVSRFGPGLVLVRPAPVFVRGVADPAPSGQALRAREAQAP
ncbi:monooxygenase, partial [Streptomyces sp. NPDC050600]